MKSFLLVILCILSSPFSNAQTTRSGTNLIGIWSGDSALNTMHPGDTIRWYNQGLDTFVPYSVQLYSKGKMREMTVYFWCGNRSWWEIFHGDARYRKGKWKYENSKGEYLIFKERRKKPTRLQIISTSPKSMLVRLIY